MCIRIPLYSQVINLTVALPINFEQREKYCDLLRALSWVQCAYCAFVRQVSVLISTCTPINQSLVLDNACKVRLALRLFSLLNFAPRLTATSDCAVYFYRALKNFLEQHTYVGIFIYDDDGDLCPRFMAGSKRGQTVLN